MQLQMKRIADLEEEILAVLENPQHKCDGKSPCRG
jgi:hypothetical protein